MSDVLPPMPLTAHDDPGRDAFEQARAWIHAELPPWLADAGAATGTDALVMAGDAQALWHYKVAYGDGHLTRWRATDLHELLIEWVPVKLALDPAHGERFWSAALGLLGLLHDRGLLDPGGDPYSRLVEAAVELKAPFLRALDATGPDPATGMSQPGRGRPVVLDAPLPDPEEAATSAAAAPLLRQARLLVDHLGDGRKLTQKQHLTLADARVLVPLLDTGDVIDVIVGDRTYKTRSSDNLPGLRLVVATARATRWIQIRRGRLVPTGAGRSLGADPLSELRALLGTVIELGPASVRVGGRPWAFADLAPVFDRMTEPLLVLALGRRDGVEHDELVDRARRNLDAAGARTDLVPWPEGIRYEIARRLVSIVLDVLELVGVLEWRTGLEPGETAERDGGTVALTPAGRVLAAEIARDRGFEVTEAQCTALSFAELVAASGREPFPVFAAELDAWLSVREPDATADELVGFAAVTEVPAQRIVALAALSMLAEAEIDAAPDRPAPATSVAERVRTLLDVPAARGAALLWLVDLGLAEADVLLDPDPVILADVLVNALVGGGGARAVEVLRLAGDPGAQIVRVQELRRVPSVAVATVLDALGAEHPNPPVARACRKAALQHRSWIATRPA